MIEKSVVGQYLSELSSKSSTPGGGAAAGLTGAQAAALMEMVCSLTTAKGKEGGDDMSRIRDEAIEARARFTSLIDDDIEGFNAVMAAYRKPSGEREPELQAALARAAEAPLLMMECANGLTPAVSKLVEVGNRNLITDVGIAALLLKATVQSARLNVLVNLKGIEDDGTVALMTSRMNNALAQIDELDAVSTRCESLI